MWRDVSHSVWHHIYLIFSPNRTIFFAVRQAFARFCHGFFQVWGKCCSKQFPTQKVYQCWYTLIILFGYIDNDFVFGRCCAIFFWLIFPWQMLISRYVWKILYHTLADVIAICMWDGNTTLVVSYVWVFFIFCKWQMLLPYFILVADGKTTYFYFSIYGWCIAMVAGVIAT